MDLILRLKADKEARRAFTSTVMYEIRSGKLEKIYADKPKHIVYEVNVRMYVRSDGYAKNEK